MQCPAFEDNSFYMYQQLYEVNGEIRCMHKENRVRGRNWLLGGEIEGLD